MRAAIWLAAVAALGCGAAPERETPVGRANRYFLDETRPSWVNDGPRPVVTTVWYPAAAGSREQAWDIGGFPGAPLFRAGHSAPFAPLAPGAQRLPLVLLSHGTGGAAAQLAWLAEHLAANGFVAAAVNHHGNTAYEPEYRPQGFVLWWERALDLHVALDELLRDEELGPRIDRDRISAAGFSLGGYTVLALAGATVDLDQMQSYCRSHADSPSCTVPPEAPFTLAEIERLAETDVGFQASMAAHGASYRDPRVRAVYAIAPGAGPALVRESLESIRVPVRVVVGTADPQTIPAANAEPIAAAIPGAELRLLGGVAHYTFLAECGLIGRLLAGILCDDPPGVDRAAVHRETASDALSFLTMPRPRAP